MSALKIAWHHRHRSSGNQHPQTGFECGEFAFAGTRSFREKYVDGFVFDESFSQHLHRMRTAVASPHRQRIQDKCSEGSHGGRIEKCISSGNGENAVAPASGERSRQGQGIQMTGMICDAGERRLRGEVFQRAKPQAIILVPVCECHYFNFPNNSITVSKIFVEASTSR
ncbi:MAG: hypothetical protein JWQ71_85 [Pedosphaera sp.]|nr:hypothetical protein [Pedosphaera sp.]